MLYNLGNTCTIDIDKVEKHIDLNNGMEDPIKKVTERLKEQTLNKINDETKVPKIQPKKIIGMKVQSKDDKKKTSEIRINSRDDVKESSDMKVPSKDESKKNPEIKVQRVKSLKEPAVDNERTKNRISRNVALNRSFNTNSKLELLK